MLTIIAVLIASPCVILTLAFAIEVAVGLRRGAAPVEATPLQPSIAIVMPAHDEAAIIGATLAALRPELGPDARVLVVADNCTDDTAAIARAAGAEIIARSDLLRRGKGFALAFARDHLAASPPERVPECVVVLDADCSIDRASLASLASLAVADGCPAQSINLLRADLDAAPMVQVSNFAFLLKNLVRQKGLSRLTGHVHLTGTGMAFPWPIFASAPLATGDVVEDLGLGLDLSTAGAAPMLASSAFVFSRASSAEGTLKQRTRWEGGFLSTAMRRAPSIMRAAMRAADPRLFWSGLSLMIPPLALLALGNAAAIALAAPLILLGASPNALIAQSTVGTLAAASVLAAWAKFGRAYLSPKAAARLPLYLVWKLPLYLGLLKRTPKTWLRAGR